MNIGNLGKLQELMFAVEDETAIQEIIGERPLSDFVQHPDCQNLIDLIQERLGFQFNHSESHQIKSIEGAINILHAKMKAGGQGLTYAEAKSVGFDTKIMRKVISLRKMETHERQEQEALLDVYMHAIEGGDLPGAASDED